MANNFNAPTGGWNTDHLLRDQRLTGNNKKKESPTIEEEIEMVDVKSVKEQIDERMKQQGAINVCTPTQALTNNNDTIIIDTTVTATDPRHTEQEREQRPLPPPPQQQQQQQQKRKRSTQPPQQTRQQRCCRKEKEQHW